MELAIDEDVCIYVYIDEVGSKRRMVVAIQLIPHETLYICSCLFFIEQSPGWRILFCRRRLAE